MLRTTTVWLAVFLLVLGTASVLAQQPGAVASDSSSAVVPPLVRFSGVLTDENNKPLTGVVGVTFALYKDSQGGVPLWLETQNVFPDKTGHYTVLLGATTSMGLPFDLFVSTEARWLGVQAEGQAEQPRISLLSVPYALKAADSQTLGGLPASAFVLATPGGSQSAGLAAPAADSNASPNASGLPTTSSDVTTTGGTANTIPMFTTSTNIQNSIVTQTSTTAINVAGKFNLPATGTATSSSGKNSQAQTFAASAYNSSTGAAVAQTFQFQAEPSGNDTSSPSGTLNVLFGSGTSTPVETGL